ncbi:MAG: iron-containing alcohol dehydrogenase [Lacrimispora celerecrescens]|nr:iron-containing alcohol dehydrogenase [Lacrimispora celerecrescens]
MALERINAVGTSFFGRGSIGLLPAELKKRGFKRGLIVTDPFLYKNGTGDKVGACLLKAGAEYAIYYLVEPNPSTNVVNECLEAANALEVDLLVAVGGGSAIDTAKAVSIVMANGGRVEDYEGVDRSRKPGIPIVAVNTTAGTGSEVTSFYIVTDPARHTKMCMVDPNSMVTIAVNDVELMMTMPKGLTASTGMDAMTHAIEAAVAKRATPFTDKDALWAMGVIREYLPEAVSDGSNEKAREMMAYGEYSAGMAFSNAGLGMVHAMAHSLGGLKNLPHGICNAVLLPFVMEFNGSRPEAAKRYKKVAEGLKLPGAAAMTGEEAVKESVSCIRRLSKEVGITQNLRELKVDPEDFKDLAQVAMRDSCMEDNPFKPTVREVIEVYGKAYGL